MSATKDGHHGQQSPDASMLSEIQRQATNKINQCESLPESLRYMFRGSPKNNNVRPNKKRKQFNQQTNKQCETCKPIHSFIGYIMFSFWVCLVVRRNVGRGSDIGLPNNGSTDGTPVFLYKELVHFSLFKNHPRSDAVRHYF